MGLSPLPSPYVDWVGKKIWMDGANWRLSVTRGGEEPVPVSASDRNDPALSDPQDRQPDLRPGQVLPKLAVVSLQPHEGDGIHMRDDVFRQEAFTHVAGPPGVRRWMRPPRLTCPAERLPHRSEDAASMGMPSPAKPGAVGRG